MIVLGMLPLNCKDLVSTLVHLTPSKFHEGMQRCSQRKLLEHVLADKIQVSISVLLQFFFFLHRPYISELLVFFGRVLTTCCCLSRD